VGWGMVPSSEPIVQVRWQPSSVGRGTARTRLTQGRPWRNGPREHHTRDSRQNHRSRRELLSSIGNLEFGRAARRDQRTTDTARAHNASSLGQDPRAPGWAQRQYMDQSSRPGSIQNIYWPTIVASLAERSQTRTAARRNPARAARQYMPLPSPDGICNVPRDPCEAHRPSDAPRSTQERTAD
jgi:hypothetical protein